MRCVPRKWGIWAVCGAPLSSLNLDGRSLAASPQPALPPTPVRSPAPCVAHGRAGLGGVAGCCGLVLWRPVAVLSDPGGTSGCWAPGGCWASLPCSARPRKAGAESHWQNLLLALAGALETTLLTHLIAKCELIVCTGHWSLKSC